MEIRLKRVHAAADSYDLFTAEATPEKVVDQFRIVKFCEPNVLSRKQVDELREIERIVYVVPTQEA
jgi:hypothetical protein